MITEKNYSQYMMKKYTDVLPFGTAREIADDLNVPYNRVRNVYYGKQFDQSIVKEILKRYRKVVKNLQPVK